VKNCIGSGCKWMQQKKTIFLGLIMGREEELEKEIKDLEAQLKDREASLPAHSVRPQQVLVIEELEAAIEEKKKELERLIKEKTIPSLE